MTYKNPTDLHSTNSSCDGSLLVAGATATDMAPITDHELLQAINEREGATKRTLGVLARLSFAAKVNTSRREQAGQLIRELLNAEAEVAKFRLGLLVLASRRTAYLDHVRSQQWVAEAIVQHEIAMADKLTELFFNADELRDYADYKHIESVKLRVAKGVLTDAEAERKVERIKELGKRRDADTIETIDRLLSDHRRYLAVVHERLAEDFRK